MGQALICAISCDNLSSYADKMEVVLLPFDDDQKGLGRGKVSGDGGGNTFVQMLFKAGRFLNYI